MLECSLALQCTTYQVRFASDSAWIQKTSLCHTRAMQVSDSCSAHQVHVSSKHGHHWTSKIPWRVDSFCSTLRSTLVWHLVGGSHLSTRQRSQPETPSFVFVALRSPWLVSWRLRMPLRLCWVLSMGHYWHLTCWLDWMMPSAFVDCKKLTDLYYKHFTLRP